MRVNFEYSGKHQTEKHRQKPPNNTNTTEDVFSTSKSGPVSTTTTENARFLCAAFKNSSTVFDLPKVITISLWKDKG